MKMRETSRAVDKKLLDNNNPKTQLARQLAEELNYKYFSIDCNLIKEGELGGMPVTSETNSTLSDLPKYLNQLSKAIDKLDATDAESLAKVSKSLSSKLAEIKSANETKVVTKYATFWVLDEIQKWAAANPDSHALLFLDEFNRSENVVMQECMNLILNREINGYKLPANVHLMLAMNPSVAFSDFKDEKCISDYMVTDMDRAQCDRFRFFFIKSDVSTWIDWASKVVNIETGETRIHSDIIEFIASYPEYLNTPNSNDDITASSRSWERLSNTYKLFKSSKGYTKLDLYNIARGDLGQQVAGEFKQFLDNNVDPLIEPGRVFIPRKEKIGNRNVTTYAEITPEIMAEIRSGNRLPRMHAIVNNCIRYVIANKNNKYMAARLVDIITDPSMPRDNMARIMGEIINSHRSLHNVMISVNDKYVDAFDELDSLID